MRIYFLIALLIAISACQQGGGYSAELETRKATLKRIAQNVKAKGDVQTAAKMEADIIALDQSDPKSFTELAKSLAEMGENSEAVEVLRTANKVIPDNAQLSFALAKAYVEIDEAALALEILTEYKGEKNADFFNILGLAHDKAGNSLAAKEAYEEGLKLNPKSNMIKNNLALSYMLDTNYNKAIEILEQLAKTRDANTPKYRANLALAYGMTKQDKKAEAILQKDLKKSEIKENLKYYRELRKGNVKN